MIDEGVTDTEQETSTTLHYLLANGYVRRCNVTKNRSYLRKFNRFFFLSQIPKSNQPNYRTLINRNVYSKSSS